MQKMQHTLEAVNKGRQNVLFYADNTGNEYSHQTYEGLSFTDVQPVRIRVQQIC